MIQRKQHGYVDQIRYLAEMKLELKKNKWNVGKTILNILQPPYMHFKSMKAKEVIGFKAMIEKHYPQHIDLLNTILTFR